MKDHMEYKSFSDDDLVYLARSDDMDAMDEIFLRYDGMVRKISSNYFMKGADEDDVIQEGRIGLLMAVMNFRQNCGGKFSSYAYICIMNSIINAVKKSAAIKNIPLNSYVSIDTGGENKGNEITERAVSIPDERNVSPEEIVLSRQMTEETVNMIISRLTEKERDVFRLYMQEMNYHQIADELGITPKSAVNALSRIKNKFRKDSIKNA